MEKCLTGLPLDKKDKQLFLRFAKSTGFADCQMQMRALEQYSALLAQSIDVQRENVMKKGKVVMSMGLIGGIFLTIVLL